MKRILVLLVSLVLALFLAACPLREPKPASSPTETLAAYRVPGVIPSDCSVDVTQALNDWIASVPDGAVLLFDQEACYRVDGTILVAGRERLTFEGNGAQFRAFVQGPKYPEWRHHWLFADSGDLVLRNMTIIGADPTPGTFDGDYAFQAGIMLCGGSDDEPVCHGAVRRMLIENVDIRNTHGDFITVGGHRGDPHLDIAIRGGDHFGAGRQGVAITDAVGVVIDGGRYEKIGASVFDLEPCGPCGDQIENITIRNTVVARFRHLLVPAAGVGHPPKNNVLIEGNVVEGEDGDRHPNGPGSAWPLIDAYGVGTGWVIRNNVFVRFEGAAIRFGGGMDNVIACNRIRWIRGIGQSPAVIVSGGAAVITNNRFVGARAAWAGSGRVVGSGNSLKDDPFPPLCEGPDA